MMEYDDSLYHWQNFFKIDQLVKFFQISKVYPKAAPRGFLIKKCSENMEQICRKTPILKCDFNKVAKQRY